ncbi:serine/threonine-protein kinase [Streptomyces griseochromogenes]|uniref:non-specific serine/threonine protein kinase n=1 Tax=Streptomyces griseochromogenes TaxID=68214 RepID=A0ABS4LIK3_9ACTN|nr:serine/threonine-protein kinase [Streptomyces griseochromogenes]MBP2047119.1 serine/threonine-protein kinase [Streptomyces griseochromogenes]
MGLLLADRYQLDGLLGQGAMGEVWRATDRTLDRAVAVKLLRAEEAADTERFKLEAQTAGRLNHPHVVGVYDFGSHHGRLYLVMELIEGWTLAQERSLRGTLPPHEAATLAAQMAAGLSAAHAQGVVHRDIKPANVMLTADRTAKITDFGIARFADDAAGTLTATGKVVGTADYLAPERALGRPAQPASDVYSLGCVLYELLTGRPPFRGATSLAVVQQHVDAAPVPPSHLHAGTPGPLDDYVIGMLAKDPAHRPTAEQAAAWLAGTRYEERPQPTPLPPAAPPPPATHRAAGGARSARSRGRSRRSRATQVALGGAGVLLFAAAAAVGSNLNSSDDTPRSPAPSDSAPAGGTPPANAPSATAPAPPAVHREDADANAHPQVRHGQDREREHGRHAEH